MRELKLTTGRKYTRFSDRTAVNRSCRGHSNLISAPAAAHAGHAIGQAYGQAAARAVQGQGDTKITEIYDERDLELAKRVMREMSSPRRGVSAWQTR